MSDTSRTAALATREEDEYRKARKQRDSAEPKPDKNHDKEPDPNKTPQGEPVVDPEQPPKDPGDDQ